MGYAVDHSHSYDSLMTKYKAALDIIQELNVRVMMLEGGTTQAVFVPSITEEEQELREMLL
jgi:hypothetical protein